VLALLLVSGTLAASAQERAAAGETLLASNPLYSQGKEEVIVRDFFRDRTNGFFLDVGAAGPIERSNTYYLEHHLGWTGIAVDALPEYGPSWEEQRPRSRFYGYPVTGPTSSIDSLLEKNGVSRIDFLSMDVEGAELIALAGFDIDRFRPELVCIEAKPVNRTATHEYFAAHGYEPIEKYFEHDHANLYFTPKATAARIHDPYREPPPSPPSGTLRLLARSAVALAVAHVIPGMLLVAILGLGASPGERWVFGSILGGPLSAASYGVSLLAGSPLLYWVSLALIDLAAIHLLLRNRGLYRPARFREAKHVPVLLLLLSVLSFAYIFTTGHYFRTDRSGSFTMDPAFTEDALFHAGLVEALQTQYPPALLSSSGARAHPYHVGYHLQLAAWERFFGIDRYDGIYRVGVLWSLVLLVFAAYSFGRRFSESGRAALGATALLFGGGLGFLFHDAAYANWWSLVFMDAALVSIFLINPFLPALPLFFVMLDCIHDYLGSPRRGALLGAGFAMVALFTVKELLAAQLLAALIFASAIARGTGAPRARRAALWLTLAVAPLLLWSLLAFPDANVRLSFRPFEIVRYSMETLGRERWVEALAATGAGRWSAREVSLSLAAFGLWLAGFLGLRLLAARGVFQDASSRSASLRSALAWFVLLGFPLTLFLRIAPADVHGLSRQEALSDAFWFATFSGIVMWFWTAETIARAGRGTWRAAAIVAAACLLAFPATVQHFVYKDSLPIDGLFVSPSAVGASAAGRALSRPDDVFVEPLRRVRPSLPAYLAGRPVVFEAFVGYDGQWVSRLDLAYRRHAVAQFWSSPDPGYGSWFLSHFHVRWIYTPRDILSPQAGGRWATPAFANDAATIYRVGTLPEVALRVPSTLPLGTRGASFFGEGWGPPESRRSRRLGPGRAVLYIPTNEAQPIHLALGLETPHGNGTLALGSGRADIRSDQGRVELYLPASEVHRGLSRLELIWQGAEPLVVTEVGLSVGARGTGSS
jgi:hypothetical protein